MKTSTKIITVTCAAIVAVYAGFTVSSTIKYRKDTPVAEELLKEIAANPVKVVVLDLSEVRFDPQNSDNYRGRYEYLVNVEKSERGKRIGMGAAISDCRFSGDTLYVSFLYDFGYRTAFFEIPELESSIMITPNFVFIKEFSTESRNGKIVEQNVRIKPTGERQGLSTPPVTETVIEE